MPGLARPDPTWAPSFADGMRELRAEGEIVFPEVDEATLAEGLRDVGGHIGYEVRPPERRRGHATAMLAAVLPHAAALGVDPALLTCDTEHHVSRRIIEGAGGRLVSRSERTLRFHVPTSGARVRGR